jgi:hypothetical protein
MRKLRILGFALALFCLCLPGHSAAMGSGPHPNVPYGLLPTARPAPDAAPGVRGHAARWLVPIFCLTPFFLLVTAEIVNRMLKTPRKR